MIKHYDLVIAGAGPAGLTAAKTAGENGLNVALLERKNQITDINRLCTMMVLVLNEYIFGERPTFNARNKRLCFPVNGFSIRYEGPTKNLYAWHFYSPGGHCIAFGNYDEAERLGDGGRISVLHSKSSLLQGLLEDAVQNGVEVFADTNVIDIEKGKNEVKVKTSEGKTFTGTFLIAADGTNSVIAKRLGFNKERTFYATLSGMGWEMRGVEVEGLLSLKTWMGEDEIPVYYFGIPRAYSDEYVFFGGGFDPNFDYYYALERFIRQGRFSHWFRNAELIQKAGSVENVYSPIAEPFKDNVLLIGDAAWCQEIEINGAILCGWNAANAVTVALRDKKLNREGISNYLNWWKRSLFEQHDYRDYLKPFTMTAYMNYEEIDYIFSLVKDPLRPCLHAFSGGQLIGMEIMNRLPLISKERPTLAEKIMKFATNPIEQGLAYGVKAGFPNR
jgi:digeranylgeranylglycerophospholipid reductase